MAGPAEGWRDGRPRQGKTILAALPAEGWTRRSAGDGTQGPRGDAGRGLPLAAPVERAWRRWRLVRCRVRAPTELRGDVVLAPQDTTRAEGGRVAGTRWVMAQLFEAATGAVGLDPEEGRRWTGGYRHLTLALEAFQPSLRVLPPGHSLAAFQAGRGLASRGVSRRGVGASGA